MSTAPPVLAIVVNWNGGQVLAETVQSLLSSTYESLETLVVDNHSSDDSLSLIPDRIRVVMLGENLGYAGAINRILEERLRPKEGIQAPEYFLLLNNDVLVPPEMVSRLVQCAAARGVGSYGPRVLARTHPETLEAAWGFVNWSHVLCRFHGIQSTESESWVREQPVELLLGSALLIHREVFERIGLFDERFFMYHEEVDFLYRASRSGIPAFFCNGCSVIHRGRYSTLSDPTRKLFWTRRNAVFFLRKHRATFLQWTYYWTTLVLSLIFNILTFRWQRVRVIVQGVHEGFRMAVDSSNRSSRPVEGSRFQDDGIQR